MNGESLDRTVREISALAAEHGDIFIEFLRRLDMPENAVHRSLITAAWYHYNAVLYHIFTAIYPDGAEILALTATAPALAPLPSDAQRRQAAPGMDLEFFKTRGKGGDTQ